MADPPGALEFRPLRRSDLPTFGPVLVGGLGALERAVGLDRLTVGLSDSLHRPGVWFVFSLLRAVRRTLVIFVAVEGGRVVGTASVMLQPRAGVVVAVSTDPSARGRGIATRLIENCHRYVRKSGRPWAALDVESENETALRVYRRLGYAEAGRFSWYAGAPVYSASVPGSTATEIPRSGLAEAVAWVDRRRPTAIREVYPTSARLLSHLELVLRFPGSTARTWELRSPIGTTAVVRAIFARANETGYLVPAAWEPGMGEAALRALVSPALDWFRSRGATRVVVALPDPPGAWATTAPGLGLTTFVSTSLMIRPAVG